MRIAEQLLERTAFNKQILEIEVGVVGGEEDGYAADIDEKLYTTEEDAMAIVRALGTGENGRYITALIFGNVHGVYKPGSVQLRPGLMIVMSDFVGDDLVIVEEMYTVFCM